MRFCGVKKGVSPLGPAGRACYNSGAKEKESSMLNMIDVVGTSPDGFSEAVQAALAGVAKGGQKAHFFQVVEQRGAVREGRIMEFQAIVRVAVEG
jgi:flavin-binding protein dodecin